MIPLKYAKADAGSLVPQLRGWDGRESVFLTGPVGTGKTYQAAALVRSCFRVFDPPPPVEGWDEYYDWKGPLDSGVSPVLWANVPKLLEDIRQSFNVPDMDPSGDLKRRALVVLDDLGAEKSSEWVEERLYCIVNDRYESGLPVIVTSNLTIGELAPKIGARLASRLKEMTEQHVVGLRGADRRMKKDRAA
jgi:DNA replication protein DnaC